MRLNYVEFDKRCGDSFLVSKEITEMEETYNKIHEIFRSGNRHKHGGFSRIVDIESWEDDEWKLSTLI